MPPTEEELYAQFQEEQRYQQFLKESAPTPGYESPFMAGIDPVMGSPSLTDQQVQDLEPVAEIASAFMPYGKLPTVAKGIGMLPKAIRGIAEGAADAFGGAGVNLGLDYFQQLADPEHEASPGAAMAEGTSGTILSALANPLLRGAGSVLRKTGDYVGDIYDKTKALTGAFSTNKEALIPGPGQIGLDEAIQTAMRNGDVDPSVMAASKNPFSDLYAKLFDRSGGNIPRIDQAGQAVDSVVGRIPGEVPYSRLDPRNVLPTDQISAEAAKLNSGIAGDQFGRDLELYMRGQGIPEQEISMAVARAKAGARSPNPTTAMLEGPEIETSAQTPMEVIQRARAFSDPANWGNVASSPKADIFRTLDSSARNEVRDLAASASPQLADEFDRVNQGYQSLSTLKDSIAARMAGEKLPPQPFSTRLYSSLTRPISGMRAVTVGDPAQNALSNPKRLLDIAAGNTMAQRSGLDTAIPGALRGIGNASTAIGNSTLAAGLPTSMLEARPANAQDGRPPGVAVPTLQSYQPDDMPGNIPRHINAVDPRMVGSLLSQYAAPDAVMPLAIQATKVFASKQPKEIARFLGALTEAYPDMPFERGPITGYASEFQMEDGTTKLFSDLDVQKWANEIENSPLREDEKAQRLRALHTDGTVYPLDKKLNDWGAPLMTDDSMKKESQMTSPEDLALKNMMSQYQFSPRRMTPFGSAKVQ